MQGISSQPWDGGATGNCGEFFNRADASSAELLALALAHARHQNQIALFFEPLLDERRPAAVIPRCILGDHRWIEALAELAVALPQQLIPSPELIGAIGLKFAAAQIQLELIGAMPQ